MLKDRNLIPRGEYCYKIIEINNNYIKIKPCQYWDKLSGYDNQESGYCHFLGTGDMEENGTMLLWDQVKECGINYK